LTLFRQGFSGNIAYSSLAFVAFTTTLHLQILATCQATPDWLLVTLAQFCWKLFINPILPFLLFFLILSLRLYFDLDLKLNYAFVFPFEYIPHPADS